MKDFLVKENPKNMDFKNSSFSNSSSSSSASSSSSSSPVNIQTTGEEMMLGNSPVSSLTSSHAPSPSNFKIDFSGYQQNLSQLQQDMSQLQQGIAQVSIAAEGDSSLQNEYLERLQELIPWVPTGESLSKLQVVQAVIDYINLLQEQLETASEEKKHEETVDNYCRGGESSAASSSEALTSRAQESTVTNDTPSHLFNQQQLVVSDLTGTSHGSGISPQPSSAIRHVFSTPSYQSSSADNFKNTPQMLTGVMQRSTDDGTHCDNFTGSFQTSHSTIDLIQDANGPNLYNELQYGQPQQSSIFPFPAPPSPQSIKAARKKRLQNKKQQQEILQQQHLHIQDSSQNNSFVYNNVIGSS